MKKVLFLTGLLALASASAAQVDDGWDTTLTKGWIDQSDFDRFQRQAERDFLSFRDSANARFARALAGKWQPFEVSKPLANPHKPEPQEPPALPATGRDGQPQPHKLPPATIPDLPTPAPPQPRKMDPPAPPSSVQQATVPFYNAMLEMEVPTGDALAECRLEDLSEASVSRFWETLARADMQGAIVQLLEQQRRYRLNDWGLYDLTAKLAQALFPHSDDCQVALTVFLLNQMEYDARMARTEKGLACLMAVRGDIYAVPYITMDDTRYYIFMPHNGQYALEGEVMTYTVAFESATRDVDVTLSEFPRLPRKDAPAAYRHAVAGRQVEIVANENLMDFYGNYPQVEFEVYATAAVGPDFAAAVERNFRPLVAGKSTLEAAAALLDYMHKGFDYATDQEQFGYEKPFFCEENFYYPKNDCEDRSILYSYLVRTLLGLEVVLLEYSDHVATAICFPQQEPFGDYYLINGKPFVVCDPTYIGAPLGMAMPQYKQEDTEVKAIVL